MSRVRLQLIPASAVGRGPIAAARLLAFLVTLRADALLVTYLHGLHPLPFFSLGVPVVSWTHDNGFGQRLWGDLVTHPVPKTQRKHELAALLDLASPFGVRTRLERPRLTPSAKATERAGALLQRTGWGSKPFIVIHLERGGRWKIWPPERMEEIIRRLLQGGWPVLLVGSRADRPVARAICRRVGTGCESLHGVIDSGVLAALLARARLFMGCDSGPAHVAQAVGCPSVLLFGGTEPRRWGPLPTMAEDDAPTTAVVRGAPGDWLAEEIGGLPPDEAMQLLDTEWVWSALAEALGGKENISGRVESH